MFHLFTCKMASFHKMNLVTRLYKNILICFLTLTHLGLIQQYHQWWSFICSVISAAHRSIRLIPATLHRNKISIHIFIENINVWSVTHSVSAAWSALWSVASWLFRELRHDSTAADFSSSLSVFWWAVPSSSQSELQNYTQVI